MAKWGEGDPRWIVEERPDAVNVNNWHWTEKNASGWSKTKLKELLLNLRVDEPGLGFVEITDLTSIEGEAIANNRKAKLIFFYEWNIKAEWKGLLNGQSPDLEVKGAIEIPNLSEENSADEVDVSVSLKTGSGSLDGDVLKELMRNKGADAIRKALDSYISLLKTEFAKDLILPTKGDAPTKPKTETEKTVFKCKSNGTVLNKTQSESVVSKDTKTLEFSEKMKCRADEFFRAMTIKEMVCAFSNGDAIVDPQPGGKFKMFDGNIEGLFVDIVENKMIKQKWRFKAWPENHYSDVTITLEEKDDHTLVTVKQTGIPASDYERTENGWRMFYFEAMKRTFGFGAMLY